MENNPSSGGDKFWYAIFLLIMASAMGGAVISWRDAYLERTKNDKRNHI